MAKRKRLAPAQSLELAREFGGDMPLETKSMPGLSAHPAPPIARVAGDASSAAALEELSETLRRARAEGRMITPIALTQIDESYLVRDRVPVDDEDMASLRNSLKARGQQTPIEVVALGDHRYGLISGWRRLQALRAIGRESVNAIISPPRDAPDAYIAMIEENEIRVGLSYFERARIVVKAVEAGVFESDKSALQSLFSNASRAKRSKIKSFIPVAQTLGNALKFPTQMGERIGLQLSKALITDSAAPRRILSALSAAQPASAEDEQDVLNRALKNGLETKKEPTLPKPVKAKAPSISPVPGIHLSTEGDSITLQGERVTPQLYTALQMWLKQRG
ncbi:ParB/RepB/Spo0J family partition protein [Planktotalea arctica]|uniref:ParB/RepB/Spo0J family partition protein n=1 Tax=Planktotalea arctica TaxID=1481893 RepID=UPI00159445AE|nr:ParB N-terminal domain-containing protein [Planktotalea arctica]